MMEAGLRLSLKDGMSAVLQKNLKLQKDFTAQVEQATVGVRSLGKAKADPVITARDQATDIINGIRSNMEQVASVVATPEVTVEDRASSKADIILDKLKELKNMAVSPIIRIKDKATSTADKLKKKLKDIATNYTPIVRIRDKASVGISKIKNTLGGLVKKPYQAILKVKDGASKVISSVKAGLKGIGSTIAKPMIALKDSATAGLSKMGGILKTLGKGVTIAVGIAGAGVSALLGRSISEGANLQQSLGGVETLYQGDAGVVIANAQQAYKTAGLSANAYMETVTSFSASLLQSLGGDTAKSASIADMAITDMADNANKFGTDMQAIQDAYQGFAKQNYTMLDNLKLGYGGTESEMERLLKDATKLTGVQYDISSLSDVYSAIHAIQEEMGVTGTTAKEASSTFSGSFASLKASVSNLFGNMALGGDITASMKEVVESASTFLFNNAIPMIGNVLKALPSAISTGIKSASPKIKELGGDIAKSLKEGLVAILPSSMGGAVESAFSSIGGIASKLSPAVEKLGGMFNEVFPQILGAVTSTIPLINPIIDYMSANCMAMIPVVSGIISTFSQTIQQVMPIVSQVFSSVSATVIPIVQAVSGLIQSAFPIIQSVISTVTSALATIMPTITSIFESVGVKIQQVVGIVQNHMGLFQSIFETVSPIVMSAVEIVKNVLVGAWNIISPIVDLAIQIFDGLLTCVEAVFPTIQSVVETVWGVLEGIFGAIADGLSIVGDAISGVAEFVGNGIDTIGSWFGFAYGKDRVPYDNYPAVLHQGEKVLTRNQADQYERNMSTRGVQLTKVEPVATGGTGGNSGDQSTVPSTEKETHNITQNIDIHVHNPVITKEADVDDVVEEMITKFRKLVPNMP